MKKEQVIRKSVSMYAADWRAVAEVEEKYGMNTSLALRFIISEWQRLQHQLPLPLTEQTS